MVGHSLAHGTPNPHHPHTFQWPLLIAISTFQTQPHLHCTVSVGSFFWSTSPQFGHVLTQTTRHFLLPPGEYPCSFIHAESAHGLSMSLCFFIFLTVDSQPAGALA